MDISHFANLFYLKREKKQNKHVMDSLNGKALES